MLAIVAAMRRELSKIEESLTRKSHIKIEGLDLIEGSYKDKGLALATIGIGGKRSREMVTLLREKCRPEALVCVGYAGGASSGVGVGDLVLYTETRRLDSSLACNEALLEKARRTLEDAELSYHVGTGVTVSKMIGDPKAKRLIGEQLGVEAIDMESYPVVEAANMFDLPVLVVRAITDTVDQRLPNLASILNATGQVSTGRALSYAATHPLAIYPMLRLSRSSGIASSNLAAFAAGFLQTRDLS